MVSAYPPFAARSRMTSIPTVVGFKDIRLFCIHRHLPCRTPPLMKLLISEKACNLWVFSCAQITGESPFFQVLVGSRVNEGVVGKRAWTSFIVAHLQARPGS